MELLYFLTLITLIVCKWPVAPYDAAVSQGGNYTLQPYGPRLCEDHCHKYQNCSVWKYEDTLVCILTVMEKNSEMLKSRGHGSRCLFIATRMHGQMCIDDRVSLKLANRVQDQTRPLDCNSHLEALTTSPQRGLKNMSEPMDNRDYPAMLKKACSIGNLKTVQCIMRMGLLSCDLRMDKGGTALHWAATYGKKEIFDYLIQCGCDIHARDDHNNTLVHEACSGGNINILETLVEDYNMSIEDRDHVGYTPLFEAIDKIEIVKYLFSRGCDPTVKDVNGLNALHLAGMYGNVEVIEYLVKGQGFDIEATDNGGYTPVMRAVTSSRIREVNCLHNLGCNMSVVNAEGESVLYVACACGNVAIVKELAGFKDLSLFERCREGRSLLGPALYNKDKRVFPFLLDSGLNINDVDDSGRNLLHIAVTLPESYWLETLIVNYSLNVDKKNSKGMTPLGMATRIGIWKPFKLLITKYGADAYNVSNDSDNILHYACLAGNIKIVRFIMENLSIDVNSIGRNGFTPIKCAAYKGHYDVFAFLIERGANLFRPRSMFRTACKGGNTKIINMIKDLMHIDKKKMCK